MTTVRHHPNFVFADTSGYFGATVARDENHQHRATAILSRLQRERYRFFTTLYVLAELHALIITRRRDAGLAIQILSEIERSPTTVLPVTADDHARARLILGQQQDKLYSLTDALSFVVMERLSIDRAFTFDRNFAQYGFQLAAP